MNPYSWTFANPDLLLFYAGIILVVATWAFVSLRYTVRWVILLHDGMSRWRGDGLPDKKATNEIALLLITWAINLVLLGGFVHAVV